MPKISILLILFEIQTHINLIDNINIILELAQSKIKRLLAYSTISHVGFILLALAINSEQSIEALIFYIIQYTITNLNTFLIIILFGYIIKNSYRDLILSIMVEDETGTENDINYISELKGQFFLNPVLSISLTICLFSMAGIPPLIGFFSKQFVLYSAIQNGYYFMSIIAIVVSIISASYYLKIIKILFTEEENISGYSDKELKIINNLNSNSEIEISSTNSFIISTLTLSILLFLNFLFSVHRPDESKISAYECGYSAIRKQNRTDFQIQFYVVAMLFLIFDLEILLLFPIAVTLYKVSTFGFIIEIGSGAISITTNNNNNK